MFHQQGNLVVETCDVKQANRYPQVKMSRWNNESNFSLRLDESISGSEYQYNGYTEKFIFKDGKECHLYPYSNGFEMGIVLHKKPVKNYLVFSLNTKYCEPYIQPELTKKELSEGLVRPDNIINSIALYSPLRGNNYQAGKMGHILRPYVIDSKGDKLWANFTYEGNGEVRLWLPPQEETTYPCWIDPTFGYTTAGGSYDDAEGRIHCVEGTVGGSDGTIDKISAYVLSNNSLKFDAAVYTDDTTEPDTVVSSETTGVAAGGTAAWVDNTGVSGGSVSASTKYWSAIRTESGVGVFRTYYDTTTWNYSYKAGTQGEAWPDPYVEDGNLANRAYSIYTTYTEGGGGGGGIEIPVVINHLRQQGMN